MIRKIFKTGHSYAVTLSKKLLEALDLKVGDSVSLVLEELSKSVILKKQEQKDQLELGLTIRPSMGSGKAHRKE